MSSAKNIYSISSHTQRLSPKAIISIVIGCLVLYYCYSKFSIRHRYARLSSKAQNLANELVLVTGGSGGIGQHIVEHLARKKARVLILDIKKPTFELPSGVAFYQTDITSTEDISRAASDIRCSYGDPTILVNAAGIFHCGPLLEKSEQQVRETFEVNTVSHFVLIKEFLPSMIKLNQGHIITVASMTSFVAVGEMIDYCCTKFSALAFHEGIKQELKYCYNAPGIKTSIIYPFWVETPMIKYFMQYPAQFAQPIMGPKVVAEAIVEQIVFKRSDQVFLPRRMWTAVLLRALPQTLQEMIRSVYSKMVRRVRKARLADKKHAS